MKGLYPDLDSAYWLKICFIQSEALPRSGKCSVTGMEFLHCLLKHHFMEETSDGIANWLLFSQAISTVM